MGKKILLKDVKSIEDIFENISVKKTDVRDQEAVQEIRHFVKHMKKDDEEQMVELIDMYKDMLEGMRDVYLDTEEEDLFYKTTCQIELLETLYSKSA